MRKIALMFLIQFFFVSNLYSQFYEWGTLAAGGGGYVTGIVAHPKEENLIYIRTDVGGVYRYEAPNEEHPDRPYWVQLMEWIPVEDKSLWSTDGIALNPQNPDEIYVALGSGAGDSYMDSDPYPQGVYKSTNRGKSWKQVLNKRFRGNQGNRSTGECLAVIPEGDGDVVLAGTRFEGLFRSEDGGSKWSRVTSVPTDANGVGIRSVAFDPSNPAKVYLTAYNSGVYASTDKGASFSLIDGTASINPRSVEVGTDGVVWITSKKGVYKYVNNELVKNSPSGSVVDYNSIAIDPTNPAHVVITQQLSAYKTKMFRTTDSGATWQVITNNKTFYNHVPWYRDEHMGAAIAGVEFNPFNTKQLWFTDWYLPWKTDDITASTIHYESVPWGVEELVIFDIVCPPTSAILYNGCADNGGLRHDSMTEYPTVRFGEQESTGIDFCELYPSSIVRVSSNGWGASGFRVSRSDDAGETWRTVYSPKETGKVAYSAKNKQNYIFIPTGSGKIPLVTKDDGASWTEVKGLPSNTYNKEFWNNYNKALVSDRINGNKFYALVSGKFYVSEDGGATFEVKSTGLPTPSSSESPGIYMAASPYVEGDIWVSIGGKGIYHSVNSGASFTQVEEFDNCKTVAVGPPITGTTPIVYIQAEQESMGWGVFCSLNGGVDWSQINDGSFQVSNNPRQMAADRSYPGRLFIGSGGRGVYCGTPLDPLTQVVSPMITPAGGLVDRGTLVTIKSLPEDAEIYYTTDGSEPTISSTRYTGPFTVGDATQIKAIAVKSGLKDSEVMSVEYENTGMDNVGAIQTSVEVRVGYDRALRSIVVNNASEVASYTLTSLNGIVLDKGVNQSSVMSIDTTSYASNFLILGLNFKNKMSKWYKVAVL